MPIVARYRDLPGAEAASATLEAAGITNTLFDADTISVLWTRSVALGFIKVHVAQDDADEARQVLEGADEIEWPPEPGEGAGEERCPFCGSDDLALESGPRKTLAVMIYVSVPLWFFRSRLRCRSCGRARVVPLRFRPELLFSWLIATVGLMAALEAGILLGGFVVSTLAKISRP